MNKKLLLGFITIIIFFVGIIFIKKFNGREKKHKFTIGILQTASHPALDQACEGFISHLKEKLKNDIGFVIQNAEGSINNAQAIAKSFHINNNINAIFAIATPAVQVIAHIEKKKPIFFAAVSDPHALGLLHPTTNVCGTSDLIDVKQQVEAIKRIFPQAKKIAILFNPSEINSVSCVAKMEKELHAHAFNIIKIGVNAESEVPTATQKATREADVILIPTDNTLALSIQVVASIALKKKKPVVVSDNLLVEKGATISAGATNYFIAGQKVAVLAIEVLVNGKRPSSIALQKSIDPHVFVNQKAMSILGISIQNNQKLNIKFI